MRSMVEGHARCFLSFIRNAAPPVPLHHLRWSPSPFRGGSSAIGRFLPSRSGTTATPNSPSSAPGARRSEERTSELQSLMRISYAVFCLKKKKEIIAYKTSEQQMCHTHI